VPSLTVLFSTFTGGATAIAASGDAGSTQNDPQMFTLEQNVLSGQIDAAIALTYSGNTTGYVETNQIGSLTPALVGSTTGDGIDISPTAGGTMSAQVSDNQIYGILVGNGIDAQAPASTLLNLTLSSNIINLESPTSLDGALVGSAGDVCLAASSNTITAGGTSAGANALEVDQLSPGSGFAIQGLGSSDPATYLETGETLSASGGIHVVATPDGSPGFTSAPGNPSACPQPSSSSGGI
jgi:hypothetical protein